MHQDTENTHTHTHTQFALVCHYYSCEPAPLTQRLVRLGHYVCQFTSELEFQLSKFHPAPVTSVSARPFPLAMSSFTVFRARFSSLYTYGSIEVIYDGSPISQSTIAIEHAPCSIVDDDPVANVTSCTRGVSS